MNCQQRSRIATAQRHRRTTRTAAVGGVGRACGTTSSIRARRSATTARLGRRWAAVAGSVARRVPRSPTSSNCAEIRDQCRALAVEQRVRHQRPREPHQLHRRHGPHLSGDGEEGPRRAGRAGAQVQAVLDEFVADNRWHQRQQEIVRRKDRDGEVFLRFFVADDGTTRVRFVEPGQVATPTRPGRRSGGQLRHSDRARRRGDGAGLLHRRPAGRRRRDPAPQGQRRRQRETRAAAVLSGAQEPSPGGKAAAQHERGGRDPIGHRPDPQASRRHAHAACSSSSPAQADASVTTPATGQTTNFRRFAPGTILDATAAPNTSFRPPASTPAAT